MNMAKQALKDAFLHQAKTKNKKVPDLQIVIGTKKVKLKDSTEVTEPAYFLMIDWEYPSKEEFTYRELTGVKIDLMQKGEAAKKNFPKLIEKLEKQHNIDTNKTEIFVIPGYDEKNNLTMGLMLHDKRIPMNFDADTKPEDVNPKVITFEHFFGEE